MNTIYRGRNYYVHARSGCRRSLFWNKVADGILSAATLIGGISAIFFLLTL